MPFLALLNGEIVAPVVIDDGQEVKCPECRGVMYPRGGDAVARHFYHANNLQAENCSIAGESDLHRKCKALALAALKQQWGEQASRLGVEFSVDVSFTPTEPDRRTGDALVEFDSRNRFFGRGLVLEVQHRNRDKNLRDVTYDYISADYSVAWLAPGHFESERLDYSVVDDMFASYRSNHDWQGGEPLKPGHAVSPAHRNPDTLGPLPKDLETYQSYPNPKTNISERRWNLMKNPWR